MTYEEALQIAMEELYDAVEVLRRNNKGYQARIEGQCNRLLTARNVLCKELEDADAKSAVLDAVERAIRKGNAPSNIEEAYEEYMRN